MAGLKLDFSYISVRLVGGEEEEEQHSSAGPVFHHVEPLKSPVNCTSLL